MSTVALVISFILLGAAALLRAAGASLAKTPRADALHDAAEGRAGARLVADLLDHRARLQPGLGIVHSALLVAATVPGVWALSSAVEGWRLAVGLVLMGAVILVGGDALPRAFGRRHPRRLAYRAAPLLGVAARLGGRASEFIGEEEEDERDDQPGDEQEREELELISSVLEFSETLVREVMVPRTDMVAVDRRATSDDVLQLIVSKGYSRIPVLGDGADDVVGICYAKDVLALVDRGEGPRPVTSFMRVADFVPETKRVSDLLRDIQATKSHMAIVVDEFGGTAGLVTLEDLLEELVGEIVDEYDTEAPLVVAHDGGGWLVDGRLPVEELSELLGEPLPSEEWDTVGGLVLGLAGRVPREGETFQHEGTSITALRVQGRRVAQVRVERHNGATAPDS